MLLLVFTELSFIKLYFSRYFQKATNWQGKRKRGEDCHCNFTWFSCTINREGFFHIHHTIFCCFSLKIHLNSRQFEFHFAKYQIFPQSAWKRGQLCMCVCGNAWRRQSTKNKHWHRPLQRIKKKNPSYFLFWKLSSLSFSPRAYDEV